MNTTTANHAVYGGSFDPPTNGHIWVIETAAARHSRLTVLVAQNAAKKPRFPMSERLQMLASSVAHLPNVSVQPLVGQELLVREAKNVGATTLIRGVRSAADFQPEFDLAAINRRIEPGIATLLLLPPPELSAFSSSAVMAIVGANGWENVVESMVPEATFDALEEREAASFVSAYARQWLSEPLRRAHGGTLDATALDDIIEETLEAHREPHRRYHRIAHVAQMLRDFGEQPSPALVLAALYDDSVYNILEDGKPDPRNEELSATRCERAMRAAGFRDDLVGMALEAIRASARHLLPLPDGSSRLTHIFLDADLAVLGADASGYRRYARRIRQESHLMPKEKFIEARLNFLQRLLERPAREGHQKLYRTDVFATLEAAAARNIAAEMELLRGGETM